MKGCKKYQDQITEKFFGEPDPELEQDLNSHLTECEDCREEQLKIQSTLETMNKYKRPEPDEEYWKAYWNKLEAKLPDAQPGFYSRLKSSLITRFTQLPPGMSQTPKLALGAALILVFGIFIGRNFFNPNAADQGSALTHEQGLSAELFHQTSNYIEKSKLILLGIVNSEEESDELFSNNFSRQQDISRQLVNQTGSLKSDLQEEKQHMLAELVTELEVILMQIANLEAEADLDGVDLIRSGAESNKILFKINLGELLLSEPQQSSSPTPVSTKLETT